MKNKRSEMIQVIIFTVISLGNLFLVSRYYPRGDIVGAVLFLIVAILSAAAAFGHYTAWKGAKG